MKVLNSFLTELLCVNQELRFKTIRETVIRLLKVCADSSDSAT